MLAERKHKIKWTPNPCGNLWAKDSSKFGQKILEKFGWSPGKGLGVNEQGIVDPVRLKCNSTQKGLGYERGKKVEIFQHQEEFNSILTNLNSSNNSSDSKDSCPSLEQTSKNCKTRVHYHKFTRGKDLSRYSEKDLSCILGVVSALENTIVSSNQTSTKLEENGQMWKPAKIDNQCDKSNEQNQLQPLDKEKQKKKRKRKYDNIDNLSINNESNSSNKIKELKTCQITIDSHFEEQSIVPNKTSSKKNKRKRKYENINDDNNIIKSDKYLNKIDNLEDCQIQIESRFEEQNSDILSENSSNKKKRKRGVKNNLVDEPVEIPEEIKANFEENQINEMALENYNEDSSEKISKKKKKKHKKNI